MSDISFADVDNVDSPIADALLGTPLFAWSGRTGDALSCNLEALLPIRGDADGGGIGAGVDPRSVNERETELARESAGVDTEATNDPERDIDKDDIGRRSRGGEGAGYTLSTTSSPRMSLLIPSPVNVPHPTYYAARLDDDDKDLDVISRSQDFVSNVSTRALIFIQAEEPVGLMCFVGVGLGEVSTCNVIVEQGQKLCKGTELGQFHFGGSTHCLIFRRGLTVKPLDQDGEDLVGSKVRVGKDILTVTK
ncbi:hypothetical protein F5J12DRAFT_897980 [Pisolithus orientalis]|uniref:uncharacterized protein n=1 Tax=Pisolithus orientalis TaxID=936130 RepID=UPI0022244F16|nr:uncharacterized protein F5J12DRAFT_897980 [Pisolithus orientalis]KAI5989192.1 hypothetical protein F5J12DRAFT_897980 [Pisolithus orientalis]